MTEAHGVARRGLDALLDQHPGLDVVRVERQGDLSLLGLVHPGRPRRPEVTPGPWTLVDLLQPEPPRLLEFAIWNHTGNVYRVNEHGAVEDDPFIAITPFTDDQGGSS